MGCAIVQQMCKKELKEMDCENELLAAEGAAEILLDKRGNFETESL